MVLEKLQANLCLNVLFSFKNRFREAAVFMPGINKLYLSQSNSNLSIRVIWWLIVPCHKYFSPSDEQPEQRHTL